MKTIALNKYKRVFYKLFLIGIVTLLVSCRSNKYIPDDKYLLKKVSIENLGTKIKTEQLYNYVQQKPNRKTLFLFKFHLAVYNIANSGHERKWKNWIKTVIGEEPVIYDPFLKDKTKKQFQIVLKNKGYFKSVVTDTVITKNKTAHIKYTVNPGKPYIINKITYEIKDSLLEDIILSDNDNSLLKKGKPVDTEVFQAERERITALLKNMGYYNFSREFIFFEIDTAYNNLWANVNILINKYIQKIDQQTYHEISHQKYFLNNVFIYPNFDSKYAFDPQLMLSAKFDTLQYKGFYFIYNDELPFKPSTLIQSVYLTKKDLFKQQNVDLTYEHLTSLGIFKLVNINFAEEIQSSDSTLDSGSISAHIFLSPLKEKSFTVEVEGTNSSASFGGDNIGLAGNLVFRNKNLFHGAELFDFSITGAFGIITIKTGETKNRYQTNEYGFKANLYVPKFLLPVRTDRFIKKYNPKTIIPIVYNFQNRPEYKRSIANFGFGYYWKGSKYLNYIVKPLNLNYVKYDNIKFELLNPDVINLYNGYRDQFIPFSNYSLNFYNKGGNVEKNYSQLLMNIEFSGNLFSAFSNAFHFQKTEDGSYKLLGSEFAQYFKYDIDLRHHWHINKNNQFVVRSFLGVAIPYGNSDFVPPLKQFYTGGAYSIRAWQARSLGPGQLNYIEVGSKYPNQLGDIKIETNFEYRFDLFWIIEGALFVDAGNIWYQKNAQIGDEKGLFKWNSFYKDIAVGTGFGTRLDFSFFIFRFDIGIPARNPSIIGKNKWNLNLSSINFKNDVVYNVAIGYPF